METIYGILAKYFKHQCSEEELEVVEAWKTKNSAEFEQLRSVWDLSDGHEFIQFDEHKCWEELKTQIENTSSLNTSKPLIKPLFKYLAAASVLVAALVTVVQINSQQQLPSLVSDDNAIEITKDVRGNSLESKELIAQTTLTNGQTVWLNKHSQLEEVIKMVAEINVEKLILSHFSTRYSAEEIDDTDTPARDSNRESTNIKIILSKNVLCLKSF